MNNSEYLGLISIIIPVYNVEKYLEQCLQSLIDQSYTNWECIVINDCSTDQSELIINKFITNYPHKFTYLKNTSNLKAGPSRNFGIKFAKGDYICFVDGDDFLPQNSLQLFLANSAKNPDIIIGNFYVSQARDAKLRIITPDIVSEFNFSKFKVFASPWAKLFRRDFWQKHNFMFEDVFGEDVLLITQILAIANKINVTNDSVYCYRENPKSVTKKMYPVSVFIYILNQLTNFFVINDLWNDETKCVLLSDFYLFSKNIAKSIDRYRLYKFMVTIISSLPESSAYFKQPLLPLHEQKKLKKIYKTKGLYFLFRPNLKPLKNTLVRARGLIWKK